MSTDINLLNDMRTTGNLLVHGGCAAVNRGADFVQYLVPALRA